eukprot:gene125-132_t
MSKVKIGNQEKAVSRTCRICLMQFKENSPLACVFHPESYAGETAQRWMAPGETKGAADIYNFYSCCGGDLRSPGCCRGPHKTFDEPEVDFSQRRPGMAV